MAHAGEGSWAAAPGIANPPNNAAAKARRTTLLTPARRLPAPHRLAAPEDARDAVGKSLRRTGRSAYSSTYVTVPPSSSSQRIMYMTPVSKYQNSRSFLSSARR